MQVKLKNSIAFKFASTLVLSILGISIISIGLVYYSSQVKLEEDIEKRGNSLITSYMETTHDSIAKGQRKTFQRAMDSMATVDGVESTYLYARSGMLTYHSGFPTVGMPFVKNGDGSILNPNIDLYEKTNGAYLRSDYAITDHQESQRVQPHLKEVMSRGMSCTECHITLEDDLTFNKSIASVIGDEKSNFYYDLPVTQDCVACHTNWQEGESAGILGLELSNENDIDAMNQKIKYIAIVLLCVGLIISIVAIILTGVITKYLNKLKDGVEDLINSKGTKIEIETKDEIAQIAHLFNDYIHKIDDGLKEDAKLIDDTKDITQRISSGHFDKKINTTANNQSLNELKHLINDMIDKLNNSIGDDVNIILNVLEEYQKLNFTAKVNNPNGKIESSINELSIYISKMLLENKNNGQILDENANILKDNVYTLTTSANIQAASLEETSASLEEITANVTCNTEKTLNMEELAKALQISVNAGNSLANDTAQSMTEIDNSTQEITNAISIIDQIAFQTNILSLNAAVEAATAGEAGKGFAVVAGEVRNLASRSAEAAKDIKTIVEKARAEAAEGKNKSSNMIQGYDEIRIKIEETLELISDVAVSSKEQLTGLEQINNAMAQLDKTTQENAATTQKTDQIATQVQSLSQKLVDDADTKKFDTN